MWQWEEISQAKMGEKKTKQNLKMPGIVPVILLWAMFLRIFILPGRLSLSNDPESGSSSSRKGKDQIRQRTESN